MQLSFLMSASSCLPLFGGKAGWNLSQWTSSDDTVRGGSSFSKLESVGDGVRFFGNLDTTTLGGAGFASQRTTSNDTNWNLSAYDGLSVVVVRGDDKEYTINLRTTLPDRRPDGRDNSTLEYAWNFRAHASKVESTRTFFGSWSDFKPTYRGRPQPDAPPLDTTQIKRFAIMMRSFFNEQHGPFSVTIESISAVHRPSEETDTETKL